MTLLCRYLHRRGIFRRLRRLAPYFSQKSHSSKNVTVLGIETSCDDTGCAVVDASGRLLGESLYSQSITHLRYGGINPVVAGDLHRDNIENAVSEALEKSSKSIDEVDAVAVTVKPGLFKSLQIGVKYAKYLEKRFNKLLIPIHHMEAHALVARMYNDIPFPYITLLISGGHCLLAVVSDVDDFALLGDSLDIAPGDFLDKAARRMKLRNIPTLSKLCGGHAIELAAKNATNPSLFQLPLPLARYRDCNFSFSGIQDAFLQHIHRKEKEHGIMGDEIIPEVFDLCASLQISVAEHIAQRTERAIRYCDQNNIFKDNNRNIVVSGGVACNNFIFKFIEAIGKKSSCNVYRPPSSVCTDNGIMIAWNGIEKLKKYSPFEKFSLKDIDPNAPLGRNCLEDVRTADIQVKVKRYNKIF